MFPTVKLGKKYFPTSFQCFEDLAIRRDPNMFPTCSALITLFLTTFTRWEKSAFQSLISEGSMKDLVSQRKKAFARPKPENSTILHFLKSRYCIPALRSSLRLFWQAAGNSSCGFSYCEMLWNAGLGTGLGKFPPVNDSSGLEIATNTVAFAT